MSKLKFLNLNANVKQQIIDSFIKAHLTDFALEPSLTPQKSVDLLVKSLSLKQIVIKSNAVLENPTVESMQEVTNKLQELVTPEQLKPAITMLPKGKKGECEVTMMLLEELTPYILSYAVLVESGFTYGFNPNEKYNVYTNRILEILSPSLDKSRMPESYNKLWQTIYYNLGTLYNTRGMAGYDNVYKENIKPEEFHETCFREGFFFFSDLTIPKDVIDKLTASLEPNSWLSRIDTEPQSSRKKD